MPLGDEEVPEQRSAATPSDLFGRWYYETYSGGPYDDNDTWRAFFAGVAESIVRQLAPERVFDAGCAKGFLVAALRGRGVEAYGVDVSEVAIAGAVEQARPYVSVGSLTDPIEGRYDLVTCIEVIEHLDPADAAVVVGHLCAAADRVLLSSTPADFDEPTHVNVQPPERWAQLFAGQGFFRDFRHDASYLTPWAALYRRGDLTVTEAVVDYERAWYQLRREAIEQRKALIDLQGRCEELQAGQKAFSRHEAERQELRKEVLRLRDSLIGKDAELATALGRVAEYHSMLQGYQGVERHLNDVLTSRSWRVMWALGRPVRALRGSDR